MLYHRTQLPQEYRLDQPAAAVTILLPHPNAQVPSQTENCSLRYAIAHAQPQLHRIVRSHKHDQVKALTEE